MPTLHLGVVDLPYSGAPTKGRHGKASATKSTGQVAEILEKNYGVMQTFFDHHSGEIAKALEKSASAALETLMAGGPVETNILDEATSQIETMFKQAILNKEFDGLIPGVPTEAAKRGVSHRFKHPYARRAPRPSFYDTGAYESSFRSWIEN